MMLLLKIMLLIFNLDLGGLNPLLNVNPSNVCPFPTTETH